MSQLFKKIPTLKVNDIFNELSEENERLLNELIFADNCLNILKKFKAFVDFVFNKSKHILNSNDSQKYEELHKEVEEVLNQKPMQLKKEENDLQFNDNFKDDPNSNSFDLDSGLNTNSGQRVRRRTAEKTIYCYVEGCPYKTHLKRNLMNHLNDTHKDGIKPFKCSQTSCKKRFFTEQSLKCHIKIAHKFRDKYEESRLNKHIGKYSCDFIACNYETKIKKLFINHTNHHKGLKPFICDFVSCGKSFISEEGLKNHIEYLHKNNCRHKCDYDGCDYETYNISRFTNHINLVHKGIRPFPCSYCRSQFGCERYLKEHIQGVHSLDSTEFKCDFPGCLKTFKTNKYMNIHYKNVHLKLKKPREKTIACDVPGCHFMGDCDAILKIHKVSHSDERPFKCSFEGCFKSFKMKGSLKSHTEECHLGKTFKCEAIGCDMSFTNRTTWKNHFNSQHSDKILQCDWPGCDYVTKLDRNLRKHKLVHKTVADYPCDWPECNKRFKSRAYLVQHLRIHNNDKRFTCNWPGCNYRCAHSGNIHKHRKIHEKKFI